MRVLALFLAIAGSAAALTVEEVLDLCDAGVADEIIIDQMEADGSSFRLSAAEIIDLQKKHVSPVVIRYMVTARGKQAPPADEGKAAPLPAREPAALPESEMDASLTVRNVSRGILSVIVHPRESELVLIEGEIEGATVLFNGSHAELPLPSGLYAIRWVNEEAFREFAVAKDVTTELEFRDDDRFAHGVRAVAIVDGREESDPYAAQAPEVYGDEAGDAGQEVTYVQTAEPVWDGHAFIEVSSHVHSGSCGHWYYDNCWNLFPEYHVYSELGYARCGDTGGFTHSGVCYARVWDGWAFLFLAAHIHGSGCGHYYHHHCWNLFSTHHTFHEHGRHHFDPCPPRSRVVSSPVRIAEGSSRRERSAGSPSTRSRSASQPQRVGEPETRRQPGRVEPTQNSRQPQRVEPPQRRQEPQRAEQPPRRAQQPRAEPPQRRQEPQRVEQPPRREQPQRVEAPQRRQEPQRVEQPPRRPDPQRVAPPQRREAPARVQPPAKREVPQRREAPKQRSSEGGTRGKRR